MKNKNFFLLISIIFILSFVSPAHYIVGYVNDALDGTISNGREIVIWNPMNGIQDNVTGIIGPTGESNIDRMYMVDCGLLFVPCEVGDNMSIMVYNIGDNYVSSIINVTVTGAGFDVAKNLTLNSPLIFSSVLLDDGFTIFPNEIDLLASITRKITCEAFVEDLDGGLFGNFYSEIFGHTSSFYGDSNDNNHHYSNFSCYRNDSYGNENESHIICTFNVWYYANSENWRCIIRGDDLLVNSTGQDDSYVNSLLSLEVVDSINFGIVDGRDVSLESEIIIYNRGNVLIDLALSGYGYSQGDGNSMVCSIGQNISIGHKKYNITSSTSGNLNLGEFKTNYMNLTSHPVLTNFNLNFRQNDLIEDAFNSTFWRVYVPVYSGGNCSGNIIFGAVISK